MLYSATFRAGSVEPVCSPDPKEIGIQKRAGVYTSPCGCNGVASVNVKTESTFSHAEFPGQRAGSRSSTDGYVPVHMRRFVKQNARIR